MVHGQYLAEKVNECFAKWNYCLHTIGTIKTVNYTKYRIQGLLKN